VSRTLSGTAIGAGIAFLACCAVFAWLAAAGASRTALMAPAALGALAALVVLRRVTPREKHVALYFAFAVLALMIFFVHETYGYTGQVRNFPLIVGYSGIVLCVLDLLSVGETRIGEAIARFFGSRLNVGEMSGRPLKREVAAFAAMGAGVLGVWLFGFLVFSPVFVAVWMLAGGKSLKGAFHGGVFTLAFVYLLFEVAFQYELFRGVVFIWLLDL
jgi:hypothetical protein